MRKFLLVLSLWVSYFTLNAQTVLFEDDFEGHNPFIITGIGDWITNDVDGSATYGIFTGTSEHVFPNTGTPYAFMVFDPLATTPPFTAETAAAHSGSQYLMSMASQTPPNNDWIISPSVTLGATGNKVKFWAKSYSDQYGLERFKVSVSTTGTNPSDFTVISTGTYVQAPTTWTEYTFDLDDYAGQNVRVAINSVSNDAWMFFIDDFSIVTDGGSGSDEDCGQGDNSNAFENGFQIGVGTNFKNTDDFYVSAGNTLNVLAIELNVISMEPIESIDFIFRDDAAGAPGAISQTVTGLVPYDQVLVGSAFGFNVYSVYVDVDLNFAGGASGTTYWMQPLATAAGGIVGGAFWEISSLGSLGSPIHTSESDGPWTADVDGSDGVFKLHCEHVVPPPPPCTFAISFDIEPITRVVLSNIDNSSDPAVNGSPALEDFTTIQGNLTPGESYNVALEGNTAGDFTTFFTVFIDWNQDGDWTDAGEMYEIGSITNSTGTDGQQAIGSIAVPADALTGTTTMRIVKNYSVSPTNPCGTYSYGQGEDYTIVVGGGQEPVDCEQIFTGEATGGSGSSSPYMAANDFDVAANVEFTLETISVDVVPLSGDVTTFDIYIYENASGPGTEVASHFAVTPTSVTPNGLLFDLYPIYTVELQLPQSVALSGGSAGSKYWAAVVMGPSTTNQQVFWIFSPYNSAGGSEPLYQSPNDGGTWAPYADQTTGENAEGVMTVSGTCGELSISDLSSYNFSYYPNPVNNELNIVSQKQIESISVYNLAGQQVSTQKLNVNNGKVSTSSLAPGVYVFRAVLDGGQVETFKVIKK